MIFDLVLLLVSATLAISALTNIIGSVIHSFNQSRGNQPKRVKLPTISVIIETYNSEGYIERCLKSLLASRYSKLDIIVVDRGSKDKTKEDVLNMINSHPTKQIRFIGKVRFKSTLQTIKYIERRAKGEIVFMLSASSEIKRSTLKQAALSFSANPNLAVLFADNQEETTPTLASFYSQYSLLIYNMTLKSRCIFNTSYFKESDKNVFYRHSVLKNITDMEPIRASKKIKMIFSSSVIVDCVSVSLKSQLAGMIRNINAQVSSIWDSKPIYLRSKLWSFIKNASYLLQGLAFACVPAILGYFVYLSIALKEPDFFAASVVALGIYLAFVMYQSESLNFAQKLYHVLMSPIYLGWYLLQCLARCSIFILAAFYSLKYAWSKI